jgi:SSS family solute:Na+ symporter
MFFPALVILPGLVALVVMPAEVKADYNSALPLMLARYYPTGILGLGLTALLASFMSGMAGNVTAFNTVWTYDIYASYIRPNQSDAHYLSMGRWATVAGVLISVGTAYIVMQFNNLMDYMQLLFSFFNAPLFATFMLGMFWRRATPWGAFWGLLSGILSAALHYVLTIPQVGILHYGSDMTANFYGAIVAWTVCFLVTILVSFVTKQKSDKELVGLVYSLTPKEPEPVRSWYARPSVLAVIIIVIATMLNIWFW